jgi:hypothetical protein
VVTPEQDIPVWYRLFFCKSPTVGFCHPLLDSIHWDSYFTEPVAEEKFENVEGTVLRTLTTDPFVGNVTFRTAWIAATLVREGTSLVYKGGVNMTTMSWDDMGEDRYFLVAHATLEMQNAIGETVRLDMSNSLPGQPLAVLDKPYVKEVDQAGKIFAGVIIGVAGIITLGMFCFIVVHRNHKVMTMAQSGLLSALAAASLVTIAFSFVLLPINDTFCEVKELLLIPATLMPTILIGRLWRVYTTLSVAHQLGRGINNGSSSMSAESKSGRLSSVRQKTKAKLSQVSRASEEKVMKLLSLLACTPCIQRMERRKSVPGKRRTTSSFRRATTRLETVILIVCLTLPQIVIQIFNLINYENKLEMTFNDDFTAARQSCQSSDDSGWVKLFGSVYLAAMFVVACYVAWCSRNLPSAFNEKDLVFKASLLSGITVIVISVGIGYSELPEVSPNVTSSLEIIMIVGVSMMTSCFVIFPKIRRVRSGEPIVMTNILRDMNGMTASSSSSGSEEDEYRRASEEAKKQHARISEGRTSHIDSIGSPRISVTTQPVLLRYDEAIPKRMERHLHELKTLCESVTNRCAEGRPMEKWEWRALLRATSELTHEFENVDMRFDEAVGEVSINAVDKKSDPERQQDDTE